MEFTRLENWYLSRFESKRRLSLWNIAWSIAIGITPPFLIFFLHGIYLLWMLVYFLLILFLLTNVLATSIILKLLQQMKESELTGKLGSK